ncbi:MAG TPA: hypothetical protein VLQ93_09465 [Myxococcaceae bacterium]|nr:hypothetical protein [Myxococcaceae bacterium]
MAQAKTLSAAPVKLSWGAIFGGTFVALGVWVLLYTLGLAIGLSAIDQEESIGGMLTPGVGTGLWTLITPIIALFVGGLVASRTAGIVDRSAGALHGAVLWGLTTVLAVVLVSWGVRAVVNAAVGVGRTAVGVAGGAIAGAAQGVVLGGPDVIQALGINTQDLLAPVNERLVAEGKQPVTAAQLQTALQSAVSTAIREGRLDRELLVTSLAQNTNLSRESAQDVAARIEAQVGQLGQQIGQVGQQAGQQVQQGMASVLQSTGGAFWFIFFSQLLSLVSGVLGASIGVTKRQRIAAEHVAPTQPAPPVGGPPRREVYP